MGRNFGVRFMSPDPENDGAVNPDPQSWNAYAYVRNDPVSLTDPTGKVYCRAANDDEKAQGTTLVCDVSDAQYVDSSKEQQAAYNKAGYTHYDCTCDSGADKDAYQHPNGNTSPDWVGRGLVLVGSLVAVRQFTQALLSDSPEETAPAESSATNELAEEGEQSLSNQEAGRIIGWGTSQSPEGVAQTERLAQTLTGDQVKEMAAKGLTTEKVEQLANVYAPNIAEGLQESNKQLEPRLALMRKILELWPGK